MKSFKLTPVYEIIRPLILRIELYAWNIRNRSLPTPQIIKHKFIKRMAERFTIHTLIETGTYLGNTVDAVKNDFHKIYTIELDSTLFKRAKAKFSRYKHIEVIKGDSSKVLPIILKKITQPAIFWLDAHYSGRLTARGKRDTPILNELNSIFANKVKRHIILIDDANYFTGRNGYPMINKLEKQVLKKNPKHKFKIEHNVIFIYPAN